MSSLDSSPDSSGIIAIIVGVVVVSILITMLTGSHVHWLPVAVSIVVGLWAVQAING